MRRWVMAVVAFLVVAGGTSLAVLVWWSNRLDVPHEASFLIGAALGGLTLRRLAGRRGTVLAAAAAFVWIAVHLVVVTPSRWLCLPRTHYAYLLAAAPLVAALAAVIPQPSARETRWRSLWLSALLTFGCYAAPATFGVWSGEPSGIETLAGVCGLMLAGGLTQDLSSHRRVWSCGGGGALLYALALLQRADSPLYLASLIGTGFQLLLGVAGAALAWKWFRASDPPALPIATTVT